MKQTKKQLKQKYESGILTLTEEELKNLLAIVMNCGEENVILIEDIIRDKLVFGIEIIHIDFVLYNESKNHRIPFSASIRSNYNILIYSIHNNYPVYIDNICKYIETIKKYCEE